MVVEFNVNGSVMEWVDNSEKALANCGCEDIQKFGLKGEVTASYKKFEFIKLSFAQIEGGKIKIVIDSDDENLIERYKEEVAQVFKLDKTSNELAKSYHRDTQQSQTHQHVQSYQQTQPTQRTAVKQRGTSSYSRTTGNGMKTARLVTGIISIVLSVLVLFQSCAAGAVNTLEQNGEVGGSGGFVVALMLLASGIVAVATRKGSKGGSIACAVMYGIGALLGFTMAGSYGDLYIWAGLCLILCVMHIVSVVKSY